MPGERDGDKEAPLRQDAEEPDTPDHRSEPEPLEPVTREALREAAARWREQPKELERLLRALEGVGPDAVPSYRVGSAEGTVLYTGLNGLGEIVDESLKSLHDDVAQARAHAEAQAARAGSRPIPVDQDPTSVAELLAQAVLHLLRAQGEPPPRERPE